jgi:dTDP-4-dehydrorhamnose 3,5-epimerase
MVRFEEKPTKIEGIYTVSKKIIGDERGHLERLFCVNELSCWSNRPVKQVNKTYTEKRGTIRGFHFQKPPKVEAKYICCLNGKVSDFALDLRKNSATFGEIFQIELDANLHNAVILPEGVAHGFQTLTENVEMLYFHSEFYDPAMESGVNILDELLELDFELPCSVISERDKTFRPLSEIEGVVL